MTYIGKKHAPFDCIAGLRNSCQTQYRNCGGKTLNFSCCIICVKSWIAVVFLVDFRLHVHIWIFYKIRLLKHRFQIVAMTADSVQLENVEFVQSCPMQFRCRRCSSLDSSLNRARCGHGFCGRCVGMVRAARFQCPVDSRSVEKERGKIFASR
ncbi:RING-type domain-containing protein [Caerostris extrusa]|uniref:RING-type domain-containing protein n=1 Tax=Caerostris extrusa TaxID=172846 RepID=A0AAV4TJ30_CAEEX|nr:RING-type domain-containing protein [Caerostris extrusa]